jgi:(E)-4-hydroxy-3-methylbut-2-enyl-diphosphate synthase
MATTDTRDIPATINQIQSLERYGCEIVRVAVPDQQAALSLGTIKKNAGIPIVADIHFDYRLALLALEEGVDGLRINPGNIGRKEHVALLASEAKARGIPIRVGVNAGSLEKALLNAFGMSAQAMFESAKRSVELLEEVGFTDIKVSLKAFDVPTTIQAYQLFSQAYDYPLHLGITEAGTQFSGAIRSACGLAILLWQGIGDTIRVSLASDPIEEVRVGYSILRAMGLRTRGVEVVACPTCGRLEIDVDGLSKELEKALAFIESPLKVAVMGCIVNGPGEAKDADIAVVGGRDHAILYVQGKPKAKVGKEQILNLLIEEVKSFVEGGKHQAQNSEPKEVLA